MKLILSPTKTMAFDIPDHGLETGVPVFDEAAQDLNRELAKLSRDQIQDLYKTSDALTLKTLEQIHGFQKAVSGPALFVFRGEAFKTLNPPDFTREDLAFAQEHLLIFSGLYGILAPMDMIRPYRLDAGTPFRTGEKSLRAFWKERLMPWVEARLAPGEPILNLASDEYASLLRGSAIERRMITLQFRQATQGKLKNNSVRSKQARGLFAKAVIKNRIQNPEMLKTMSPGGYAYSRSHSRDLEWWFIA